MATTPEREMRPTRAQKIAQTFPARHRILAAIAVIAAAGTAAAEPFGALIAAGAVFVAWDYGRRR